MQILDGAGERGQNLITHTVKNRLQSLLGVLFQEGVDLVTDGLGNLLLHLCLLLEEGSERGLHSSVHGLLGGLDNGHTRLPASSNRGIYNHPHVVAHHGGDDAHRLVCLCQHITVNDRVKKVGDGLRLRHHHRFRAVVAEVSSGGSKCRRKSFS